jgi:glycosyltransferase involved in cell wall biosynthesis
MLDILYIITDAISIIHVGPHLEQLSKNGWRVGLIYGGENKLTHPPVEEAYFIPFAREIDPFRDLKGLLLLVWRFVELRPRAVNAGTPKAGLLGLIAAWITRVPVRIYQLHGLRLETATGWRRRLLRTTERIACACAHKVLCVSGSLRQRAVELGLGPAEKFILLGAGSCAGVDVARFAPSGNDSPEVLALRTQLNIAPAAAVMGCIGRFTRDKGIIELLEAFKTVLADVPNAVLLLIGSFEDGDPLPASVRQTIEKSLNIRHVAWTDNPAPYLHLMDMVVLATYREGLPVVLLEAGAAEKPCVSTYTTGVTDVVVHGRTGLLSPVGDAEALATNMLTLIGDRDLAQEMGRNAREHVQTNFSRERVLKNLELFYESVAAESPCDLAVS